MECIQDGNKDFAWFTKSMNIEKPEEIKIDRETYIKLLFQILYDIREFIRVDSGEKDDDFIMQD